MTKLNCFNRKYLTYQEAFLTRNNVFPSIAKVTTINGKLHELIKDYTPEMEKEMHHRDIICDRCNHCINKCSLIVCENCYDDKHANNDEEEKPIVRFVVYYEMTPHDLCISDVITRLCIKGTSYYNYEMAYKDCDTSEKIAKLEIYKTKPINVIKDYKPELRVDVFFVVYDNSCCDNGITLAKSSLGVCYQDDYLSYSHAKYRSKNRSNNYKIAKITITHNADGSKLVVPQLDYKE